MRPLCNEGCVPSERQECKVQEAGIDEPLLEGSAIQNTAASVVRLQSKKGGEIQLPTCVHCHGCPVRADVVHGGEVVTCGQPMSSLTWRICDTHYVSFDYHQNGA